ncbi:neuronal acetylcholine receptor subunit alpha-4 isoform X1 [Octopus bimaculoides]|uniref:neuronal acetylcholine receptor subunit alpha-4 isoform X1 n=2 Tax=Octopus bimaculoides TaxID=37653 RepID=UPI00071C6614|nr:neuronal acetylcholine receptor subunit alpha-4 isoform X1 [Octopus bimaculoides]|eukprot:XP_014781747.1 PREDICTED: neuronal acetylcholine receptor subunit alpha-4-like [Octopus bimaculoides]
MRYVWLVLNFLLCTCTLLSWAPGLIRASEGSKGAYHHIMCDKNYNKLIRPAGLNNRLVVRLGIRISQILKVDEKNQVLETIVWLKHEWYDLRLTWNPEDFGGETMLHIPSEDLWRPDIVVYNNADGDFVITMLTKALVSYDGKIVWEPPAIYKTYCPIDVEYFPFDTQLCFMKFSSWTYDGNEVDLIDFCHGTGQTQVDGKVVIANGIDMKGYSQNSEWEILNVTSTREIKTYPCCPTPYPIILYNITMRRIPQFYTLNLIIPCVSISFLTILVFYLPSVSGEKITLSISVLLALTVFFLLLSEIIPPTSLVIPLICKYLMFTMLMVTASLFLTVYVLNVNYRTTTTHTMSQWVRYYFLERLPTFLMMKRPRFEDEPPILPPSKMQSLSTFDGEEPVETRSITLNCRGEVPTYENMCPHQTIDEPDPGKMEKMQSLDDWTGKLVEEMISNVEYIASTKKDVEEGSAAVRDWAYISTLIDRLFLWVFSVICTIGTVVIYLNAPSHFDTRPSLAAGDFVNLSCTF